MNDETPQPYKQPEPLYEHTGNTSTNQEEIPTPTVPTPPIPEITSTPLPTPPPPPEVYTPKKLGKWKASKMLIRQSLNLLKKDKEVLLFPILASGSILIITIIMIVISIFAFDAKEILLQEGNTESLPTGWYICLFIMYTITMFVTTYFQAGLVTVVDARIN